MKIFLATTALLLMANAASAASPREVVLNCASATGLAGEFVIQSGFKGDVPFSYLVSGPGLNAAQVAAINVCADRRGGFTGLGAAGRPTLAATLVSGRPVVASQPAGPGCAKGYGLMQRGNLYCIGY